MFPVAGTTGVLWVLLVHWVASGATVLTAPRVISMGASPVNWVGSEVRVKLAVDAAAVRGVLAVFSVARVTGSESDLDPTTTVWVSRYADHCCGVTGAESVPDLAPVALAEVVATPSDHGDERIWEGSVAEPRISTGATRGSSCSKPRLARVLERGRVTGRTRRVNRNMSFAGVGGLDRIPVINPS